MNQETHTGLYEILGIKPSASKYQIKSAFRRLAKVHHPDRGGDIEKFREIQEAYEVLLDPKRRAHYDATGEKEDMAEKQRQQQEAHEEIVMQQRVFMFFDQRVVPMVITKSPFHTLDEYMDKLFKELHTTLKNNIKKTNAEIEKYVAAKKLYKYKGDKVDVIGQILQKKEEEMIQAIKETEKEIKFIEICQGIITEYEFAGEEKKRKQYVEITSSDLDGFHDALKGQMRQMFGTGDRR